MHVAEIPQIQHSHNSLRHEADTERWDTGQLSKRDISLVLVNKDQVWKWVFCNLAFVILFKEGSIRKLCGLRGGGGRCAL